MIDFATLQGLTIPEGVVTQITDAAGNVLWSAEKPMPVVLGVKKITSDTYASETAYTGEQFILLNIYPKKSNGVVNVTYGGLTKTLTFSGTNAQKVYFGTFNGVADSVATPESGELTIEGDYKSFAVAQFSYTNKNSKYCGCITSVVEWGNLKTIEGNAFYDCTGLTTISIPTNITGIGSQAFFGCNNLSSISIPPSVTSIGSRAFSGCANLSSISIPPSVTSIGDDAFGASGVKSVYISDMNAWCRIKFTSASSMPSSYNLYLNNALVTHVDIPSSMTEIAYTFHNCASLQSVSFPSGFTTIGTYAFSGCTGLTNFIIPTGITVIGSAAFSGCTGLTSITIPDSVTDIKDSAFSVCHNLVLTSLPNGLVNIGGYAFAYCYEVSIGEIPEGVRSIGNNPFQMYVDQGGSMPNTIILPSTIESIGSFSYQMSSGSSYNSCMFDKIIIRATTPPQIGADAFGPVLESTMVYAPDEILVPAGCGEVYKAAEGWSNYASIIKEGA